MWWCFWLHGIYTASILGSILRLLLLCHAEILGTYWAMISICGKSVVIFYDDIFLFALKWHDFRLHKFALETELKTSKFSGRSARERFLHNCEVHYGSFRGRVLSLEAAGFDFLSPQSSCEYMLCCWSALTLEEDAPCIESEWFQLWCGNYNKSGLAMEEVYVRLLVPAGFWTVLKGSKHFWQQSAPFERLVRDQHEDLVPHECVKIYLFTNFSRVSLIMFRYFQSRHALKCRWYVQVYYLYASISWVTRSVMMQTAGCGSSCILPRKLSVLLSFH